MRMFPIPDPCKTEQLITPQSVKTENTARSLPILWAFLVIAGLQLQVNNSFSQSYRNPGTYVDSLNSDLVSPCTNCTAEDIKAMDFWLAGYGPKDSVNGKQCLDSGVAINYSKLVVQLNVTASERYGLLLVANLHVDSTEATGNNTYYRTLIYGSNKTYKKGIVYDTFDLPSSIRPLLKAGWRVTIKNVFLAWDNNDFTAKGNGNKTGPYLGLDSISNSNDPELAYRWDCKAMQGNALTPHCKKQDEVWIIKLPTKPLIRSIVTNNVTCPGGTNGSIVLSVGPWFQDYTYLWNTGATTSYLNNLASGTYNVTVTAGSSSFNCTTNQNITVNTLPAITFTKDSVDIACKGGATGKAKVTITGGGTAPFTFSWNTSVNHTVLASPTRDSA
ncbi:MAG: SprB repeat-containing protein, partial [Chitinophagaceae bacterium]